MITSSKTERLSALKDICLQCTNCELFRGRKKLVFGEGNPESWFFLIGEGPGREEDISGMPFVGRSGHLLRKLLMAIGLDPENDCYIANTVKCRPPANRVPYDIEMGQCIKFLKKQVELTTPRPLGRGFLKLIRF